MDQKHISSYFRFCHLQALAIKVYESCFKNSNIIHPIWISREENSLADFSSRSNDTEYFQIDYKTLYFIQRRLKKWTVDRFADNQNKQNRRFTSKFYCTNTETVNAFTCEGKNELNWLASTINLIGKTIKCAADCNTRGILMIPLWESRYFIRCSGMAFVSKILSKPIWFLTHVVIHLLRIQCFKVCTILSLD